MPFTEYIAAHIATRLDYITHTEHVENDDGTIEVSVEYRADDYHDGGYDYHDGGWYSEIYKLNGNGDWELVAAEPRLPLGEL